MTDPKSRPTINPYAVTFEEPEVVSLVDEPDQPIISAGEVISNGILGVAVSGAALGFATSLIGILGYATDFSPRIVTVPLIGIMAGFAYGAMLGMFTSPLVYLLFAFRFAQSADRHAGFWTSERLKYYAAVCGFTSSVVAGLLTAFVVSSVVTLGWGVVGGVIAAAITVRVFAPLRLMVNKRITRQTTLAENGDD